MSLLALVVERRVLYSPLLRCLLVGATWTRSPRRIVEDGGGSTLRVLVLAKNGELAVTLAAFPKGLLLLVTLNICWQRYMAMIERYVS